MKQLITTIFALFVCAAIYYFNQDRLALYIQKDIDTSAYTFTSFNNIQSVRAQGNSVRFIFDEEQQRVKKIINGQVIEKYHWLGEQRLHLVTDARGNVLREYLYDSKHSALPYAMRVNGKTYRFIYNPMHSLRLVFDEEEHLVKMIDYDSRGKRVKETNPSLTVDYSYAGGIQESVSKLLFFVEGVYNPAFGKWITRIKRDDVIENLRALNQLENDTVYECEDTLDTYYHSYLCVKGKCGGLYATEYLNYFNGEGVILDNSNYFKPARCALITLPKNYDQQDFTSCVTEKIAPRNVKLFDAIEHNCHHEVEDIINTCKITAYKGQS